MIDVCPVPGSGTEIHTMNDPSSDPLKKQMHDFWNEQSCDTQVAKAAKFTREYFEEIETLVITHIFSTCFQCSDKG